MATISPNYHNRFDPSKEYEEHLFIAGRGLQSAELNEIQQNASWRLRGVADVLFKNGAVIRDASISVNPSTGALQCRQGAVYIAGAVRGLAPENFTIATTGSVTVGVRMIESIITSAEDIGLRDPVSSFANYDQAGADRLKLHCQWGWVGVGGNDGAGGQFYPVYEVVDGVVSSKEPPPNIDAVAQSVALYDRDNSGGSYIVTGMKVSKLDDLNGNQVYSIADGRARVFGFGVEFKTSRRTAYTAVPDLRPIVAEPHDSYTSGSQVVGFSNGPGVNVTSVIIVSEKTETMTRGVGAKDYPQETGVVSLVSITQGGTTYQNSVDYYLNNGDIDWSLGGSEPASGSSYSATYRYTKSITPTGVTPTGLTVTGAVAGTSILISYSQMLPRIDRLCLDLDGHVVWVKGVASATNPQSPVVPGDLLSLARIHQTWWASGRVVASDGVRMVSMTALASIDARFDFVIGLLAQQRLENNIHIREGGTKKGIFVDPFIDDSHRDAGVAQTAAIVGGHLVLPISATVYRMGADISQPTSLNYNPVACLEQLMRTSSMSINPYMAFTVPPAVVTLDPAVDRWTIVDQTWASPTTRNVSVGSGNASRLDVTVEDVLVSRTETSLSFLRPITVSYRVEGFGSGENLSSLTFDGVALAVSGAANSSGVLTGSFTIPANIPAGEKLVSFSGQSGTVGSAVFSGLGSLDRQTWTNQTTFTTTSSWVGNWINLDPLAQTFTLDSSVQAGAVDVWFTARPTSNVLVQIRETTAGMPNQDVVMQVMASPDAIMLGGSHTRFQFPFPVFLQSGVEYAIVVLCNDAIGAISVAALGEFDESLQRWATSQPYTVGTLLSSSNASSWTVHQDRDMTFRLFAASFTESVRTVQLGNVPVSGATDLLLLANSNNPTSATFTEYQLTLPDATVLTVDAGQPISLTSSITGNIAISAKLHGTSASSPLLFPGTQLVSGAIGTSGSYVSLAIDGGTNVTVKVVYEAALSNGATVSVGYAKDSDLSTWVNIINPSSLSMGNGFTEYTHTVTGVNCSLVRIKLLLTGSAASRPRVRDLRVIVL